MTHPPKTEQEFVSVPTEADKARARGMVRRALEKGDLSRPTNYTRCGKADTIASSGRHTIHAHHHAGYHLPLDVEWLCARCHRKETPLPSKMGWPAFGVSNGAAKLTPDIVRYIRGSVKGCRSLGREIGVHKSAIQRVRKGELWSHVS